MEDFLRRLLAGVAPPVQVPAPVLEVLMVEKLLQRLVVAAPGGGNADSPAYSCGGARACGNGNFAQIVTFGAAGIGAAASAGILPA